MLTEARPIPIKTSKWLVTGISDYCVYHLISDINPG